MNKPEAPVHYEYDSWRLEASVEEMGKITATRYWKSTVPNVSEWYKEDKAFDTLREALEWIGEVV